MMLVSVSRFVAISLDFDFLLLTSLKIWKCSTVKLIKLSPSSSISRYQLLHLPPPISNTIHGLIGFESWPTLGSATASQIECETIISLLIGDKSSNVLLYGDESGEMEGDSAR